MATSKTRQTKKEDVKRWSEIDGRMRVFGREIETKKTSFMSYSTSIGAKNDDGEYDNVYFNVKFKKDSHPDIDGAFEIDVKAGFLTVTTDRKGNAYPAVMILDYDVVEQ